MRSHRGAFPRFGHDFHRTHHPSASLTGREDVYSFGRPGEDFFQGIAEKLQGIESKFEIRKTQEGASLSTEISLLVQGVCRT